MKRPVEILILAAVVVVFCSLLFVYFGPVAQAASLLDGLGSDPNICDVFSVLSNVRTIAFELLGLVGVLFVMYGGIRITVSFGNSQALAAGKATIQYALLGMAIVLLAWLLVGTIFMLVGRNTADFWRIDCDSQAFQDIQARWAAERAERTQQGEGGLASGASYGKIPGPGVLYCQADACATLSDADSDLADLILCLDTELVQEGARNSQGQNWELTSISQAGRNGPACLSSHGTSGGCVHTAYSCHYGGRDCSKSVAFDINARTATDATSVRNAVRRCVQSDDNPSRFGAAGVLDETGSGATAWATGAHAHVSIKHDVCGCDSALRL